MVKYRGLSTDAKPSVEPGSEFFEMDTGKTYLYDGTTWNEQPASGGGGDITVVSLTASSNATYSAPSGKAYDPVIVNVPATPAVVSSISISANGTYSAPAGVDGYNPVVVSVSGGGDDSATKIIERTISGAYENSTITKVGSYAFCVCSSLTAASFPAATSIGYAAFQSCTSLTTVSFPAATSIGGYAFNGCRSLTAVNFPSVTLISTSAFASCSKLATVSFPAATEIGNYAFASCSFLTAASLPVATYISDYAFVGCSSLATISFPAATSINGNVFSRCKVLESVYFLGPSVPTLGMNAFNMTPMSASSWIGHWGSIFVKSSLLDTFKTSTNWTTWSARMVGLTDAQIEAL